MTHHLFTCLLLLALSATAAATSAAPAAPASDTATISVRVSLAPPPEVRVLAYDGCTLTAEAGDGSPQSRADDLTVRAVVPPGSQAKIKIRRLKEPASSASAVAGGYLYLPDSAHVGRIEVTGDVAMFYTDTSVGEFSVTGSIGSVAAQNAAIASISATGAVGSVWMASTPTGSNPAWAVTRVATGGPADRSLSIQLQGIVLENLQTTQPVSTLSAASKVFRAGPGKASSVAPGGLGRIAPAAIADTTAACSLAAASFGSVRTTAASIRLDGLVALQAVRQIAAKSVVLQGTPRAGMIGWEGQPERLLMRAEGFQMLSGDSGVHGRFWAGYDALGPTCTGAVGSVAVKAGLLSGELCVAPATVVRFKPGQGEMLVLTGD